MRLKNLYYRYLYKFSTFYVRSFYKKLHLGKDIVFKCVPSIYMIENTSISIGNNVTINSSNWGYHVNMFGKCKFFVDRNNAKITIGDNCRIHGTCIHAYSTISIGNNCLIAANTQIVDTNGHALSFENTSNRINTTDSGNPITIEDNVWIGMNCVILGGTTIGQGAVIAASSVVKGNVPPNCIFGGNPAKVIKQY